MRLLLVITILILISSELNAQRPGCSTKSPDENWEIWYSQKLNEFKKFKKITGNRAVSEYTIPVIVHVLHHDSVPIGAYENISQIQVQSAIDVLNADFSASNADYSSTPVPFQPFRSGDIGISFCLAKVDTNNILLAEEGVHRINWISQGFLDPGGFATDDELKDYFEETIKPATIWDPTRYFNVWTYRRSFVPPDANIINYAKFPIGSGLQGVPSAEIETDSTSGVVIEFRYFGDTLNISLPPYNKGRTVTHEVGHYLGVRHIWGDSFCGNDYCDDTPKAHGSNSDCPDFPHPFFYLCYPPSYWGEMFMNFMDYTCDTCKYMFTMDQAERMQTAMMFGTYRAPLMNSTACQVPCPDLTIIAPSVTPNQTYAGDSVLVSFAEDNSGTVASIPNYVSFHLSPDNVLTPGINGDVFLNDYFVDQSLAPSFQTILLSKLIHIPQSISPGTYYLFFSADGTQVVEECSEQNNFATAILTVSDSLTSTSTGYKYWFDNQFSQAVSVDLNSTDSIYLISDSLTTQNLSQGLHTLHFTFKDTADTWSSIISSPFVKLVNYIPAGSARYEYWYNGNYNTRIVKTIANSSDLFVVRGLNMGSLQAGLNSISFRFKPDGKHWSSSVSSLFYKIDPAFPGGPAQFEYWFDNSYTSRVIDSISYTNDLIILDSLSTSDLVNGLHTFHWRGKPNGTNWSPITSDLFYKKDSIILNNKITRFVYWYDNDWQNAQTIVLPGLPNDSLTIYINAEHLPDGPHTAHMFFREDGPKWSSIISSNFEKDSIVSGCPVNDKKFGSGIPGAQAYQWQVNTGTGFVNLTNGGVYTGVNVDSLIITGAPTSWYGYKYRCLITTSAGLITGETIKLRFSLVWDGSESNAWEQPQNWNCNVLPDAYTDVYIPSWAQEVPEVNTNTSCRFLYLYPGTQITMKPGNMLTITGNNED